jgi:hypothetical protein
VTVNWQTLDATPAAGHGTATAGTDFTYPASAGSRLVTFDAGGTSFRALASPLVQLTAGMAAVLHYRTEDVMVFDPGTEMFIR